MIYFKKQNNKYICYIKIVINGLILISSGMLAILMPILLDAAVSLLKEDHGRNVPWDPNSR